MEQEIITIGEALIDFIPQQKGCALKDVDGFVRKAGGAPTNVAAAVAKLGASSSVITQVGMDAFGDHIIETLRQVGVNTDKIFRTQEANTALAFVSLAKDGNRSFSFYRKPCADLLLGEDKLEARLFEACYALHFCSVDLIESPMKQAHKKAIALAKDKGALISFDPNVRLPLFDDPDECRRAIHTFLPYADLVKVADDELEYIFGSKDEERAKKAVFDAGAQMLLVTRGSAGAAVHTKAHTIETAAADVTAMDTTGAGDSFIGAFLCCLMRCGVTKDNIGHMAKEELREVLEFSNYYAAYTTTNMGAIEAMATRAQIEAFIEKQRGSKKE